MKILVPVLAILACACSPSDSTPEPDNADDLVVPPAPSVVRSSAATGTIAPDPIEIERADYFPAASHRNLDDLVRGCQGMSPDRRPRGSNCFGIFPEQCGAEKAQAHIGEVISPALQGRLTGYSPGGDIRIIKPGDTMIEDLRFGRLNVAVDAQDKILSADCF